MLATNLPPEKLKVKNSWRAHLHKLKSLVAEPKEMDLVDDVFFLLRAEPHVPMWPIFIHQRQKINCRWWIFFWVPQSPKIKSWKKFSQPTNKNWKQLPTKNSQHRDMMLCLQNENSCKKKLSATWIDSRFFSFSTVDNRQRISAPCSKKLPAHF